MRLTKTNISEFIEKVNSILEKKGFLTLVRRPFSLTGMKGFVLRLTQANSIGVSVLRRAMSAFRLMISI